MEHLGLKWNRWAKSETECQRQIGEEGSTCELLWPTLPSRSYGNSFNGVRLKLSLLP